jgi:outer membrane protein assembly factor BamA
MRIPLFSSWVIICSLLFAGATVAQTQKLSPLAEDTTLSPIVAKIVIEGNRRTKTRVILHEMRTQVGDTIDVETLQADQKRILNLGLFNRVEIDPVPEPEGIVIVVSVTERLYLFPYPIFFINERDWGKISFGAGVVHSNFRGRNEQLMISGWAGYNPAFQVYYTNPWLFGPSHLLTSVVFSAQRVRNRSFLLLDRTVDEKRIGGSWGIGRRFGLFTYLSLNFSYSELKFDPPVPGQTLDPSGRDRLPSLGLLFLYDARDLFEYPRSGIMVKLWAVRTGFNSEYIHYLRYGADLRGYKKIYRGLSLGARAMTDLSHDNIPIYDRVFLGYTHRVRGHFNRQVEGENVALASTELRFPILPWRYFSLNDVPAFGPYLQNMKFGMSGGIFVDYGRAWFQNNTRPRFADGLTGFGAGLHIHLPYVYLLRLEWAFDEDGRSEWIADLGVAF